MKEFKLFKTKKFKYGSLSLIFTVMFIAIIIFLNIGLSLIISHFNLQIDLTDNRIYKISDQTSLFIKNYQNSADIYVLDDEETYKNQSKYSFEAYKILKSMVSLNDNLNLVFIDLDQNPNFSSKYHDVSLQSGGILIVDDKENNTFISPTELFSQAYNSTTGDTTELLSNVEQTVARSLEYISGENPVKTLILSGHSETDISSYLPTFEKNGYTFNTVNLLNSTIDDATDLIIIASPTVDYSKDDIQKLENYLSKGGSLVYFASSRQGSLPNLDSLLEKYGIVFETGTVVETDSDYILSNSSSSFYLFASNNDYTENMTDKTLPIAVSESRPMDGKESDNISLTDICSTQESCVKIPVDSDNFDYSTASHTSFPTVIGAVAQNDDSTQSKITAFSNIQILGAMDSPTFGNGGFIMSVFGQTANHHSQISVLPKSLKSADLGANASQIIMIGIVFLIIVPVGTLIIGFTVKRKRKKANFN